MGKWNLDKVYCRGNAIRYVKIGEEIWYVAKDIAKALTGEKKITAILQTVTSDNLQKFVKEETFITLINESGINQFIIDGKIKVKNFVDDLKSAPVTVNTTKNQTPRQKIVSLMKKKANYKREFMKATWSEMYTAYSSYIGYNLREKAREENMTNIDYLDSHGLLEDFYEFAVAYEFD